MIRSFRIAFAPLLLTFGVLSQAQAAQVYFNNFSTGAGPEWTNPTTTTSNGEAFLGQSANGFGAGTDTLTLTGLAPHTSVTLDYDLYIIQSWDGNGPAGGGPDNWQTTAGGVNLLFTNFANFTGFGNTQAYTNQLPPFGPGGTFAPRTGASAAGHLGFGTGDFGDATYHFSHTFSNAASSLAFAFTSFQNQAPGDEGWGLDNVRVTINGTPAAVPEPASLALLLAGMVGLGLTRRRNSSK